MRRGGTQHALTEANEKLEKANAEFQRRVTALEGRAREAEAALQESLQRQEKMAAMYEESILERAGEEAADSEEAAPPRAASAPPSKPPTLADRLHADIAYSSPAGFRLMDTSLMRKALEEAQKCPCFGTVYSTRLAICASQSDF